MSDLLTRAAVDAVINALLNNGVPDESIEPDEHNQMLKDILDTLTGLDKTLRYQNETLGYSINVSQGDAVNYENSTFKASVYADTLTADRIQTHQDKDGVIALLSDIAGLGNNWANFDLILTADRTHDFDDFGIQQDNVSFVNWDNVTAGSFFNLDLTYNGTGFNAYLVGGTALTAYNFAYYGYTMNGGGVGGTFENSLDGISGTWRVTPGGGTTAGLFLSDNKFRTRGYATFESKESADDTKLNANLSYYLYATAGVLQGRYRDSIGGFSDILFNSTKIQPGTNGQFLSTTGGASAWANIQASNISGGAALTKTDDTNVTLTLGGSPSSALLAATSLTLGWSGTLSAARGGTSFSTYTTGDILYSSATNTLSKLGIGSAGQVLTVSGGIPSWQTPTSGTVTGTGTTNYLARWTSSTALGIGILQDNGTTSGNSLNANYTFNMVADNFAVARFQNTRTGTGTAYGLITEATGANAASSNIALRAIANNATGGQNFAIQGEFSAATVLSATSLITGTGTGTAGLFQAAHTTGTTYGIISAAAAQASQAAATFVGGYFHAQNGGTANYSLKLVDGTEGAGKFLKSITAGGLANWANISHSDIAVMTSAQFAALISDETGTAGSVVFSNTPTLVTPILGVATATSINGNIFSGAINSTWSLSNNKTFSVSSSLAFSGIDGTSFVFPSTSGTVVTLAETQTLSNKTLDNTNTATFKDTLFTLQDDGDTTKQAVFQLSGITTATTRTFTLPNANDTLVGKATTDTFTNKTLTASSNVLGGVTMTLGSDATGDVYYRNSGGVLTRLGIGSTGQVLTVAAGLPSWAAGGGGGMSSAYYEPFGNINLFLNTWSESDQVYYQLWKCPYDMTITKLWTWTKNVGTGDTVRMAICNSAGTLLQSTSFTPAAIGFESGTITSTALTGGTLYWLAIKGETGSWNGVYNTNAIADGNMTTGSFQSGTIPNKTGSATSNRVFIAVGA